MKKPLEIAKYASAEKKLPLEIAEYASAQRREFRRFVVMEIVQRQAACGDGTIAHMEECDDGNKNNADGCSASCKGEGACVATNKDAQQNHPNSTAPNAPFEGRYAKQYAPVNTISELKITCDELTYQILFQIYCQKNTNPAPAQYRVIHYTGDGSPFLTECDDSSCEYHPCAFPQLGTTPGIVAQE